MPVAAHNPAPHYADWRDRYELVRRIGSGASAEVFEAHDRVQDEPVALKIVPDGRALTARIAREVEAAAALEHPNIVALHDWFSDGASSVLVWELVRGESLDRLGDRLRDADVVALGVELLDAIACAHRQGIVHRDVKPQNVMLDEHGHVKVMDFGIAHLMGADTLTGDGDLIGTVAYMSPEQAQGRRVQPASDVYSAGVVLYELLAGEHPLRGGTPAETYSNVATARLPSLGELRPDLPGELVDLIDAACAPRPADRPAPADLRDDLDDLLREGLVQAGGLRRARRLFRPLWRAGGAVERAGGAALSAATGIAVLDLLPAYPQSWTLPLVAVCTAVWAVLPEAGLALLLGVLAFPVFNVSLSLGAAYLLFAVAVFLLARGRPVVALWPAFALLLTPAHLTLLAPATAALLGRARGPLAAAWAGIGTMLFLLLTQAAPGPFTLEQPRSGLAAAVAAAGDPVTAAGRLLAHAVAPPALVQAALWAGLAAALALALTRRRLETRLWIWSLSFAALAVAYRVVPVAVWGYPAPFWPLVLSVALPAAVILFPLVMSAGEAPDEGTDGDLQEGE